MKDVSELFDTVVLRSQILKELFPNRGTPIPRNIRDKQNDNIDKLDFKITEKNNAYSKLGLTVT